VQSELGRLSWEAIVVKFRSYKRDMMNTTSYHHYANIAIQILCIRLQNFIAVTNSETWGRLCRSAGIILVNSQRRVISKQKTNAAENTWQRKQKLHLAGNKTRRRLAPHGSGRTSVPEENRDLAGCNFCANFAFLRKIAIFREFCLGAQFLCKFGTLWSAIFRKIRKFCNLRAICANCTQF